MEYCYKIAEWIKDYFQETGKTKAIVGISGGIDSAVVASLCVKALGKENVLGVIIPIESSIYDGLDAMKVIEKLGIDHIEVHGDSPFYKTWQKIIDSTIGLARENKLIKNHKLVKGNVKARIRMTTLYAISEMTNGLVVGTTNKTEALIGYATKYGDGGVDIEPIMDYYKTEVFEMARYLDVPVSIINKKPSAGLWDGQTDEDELGMSYAEIDMALKLIKGEPFYGVQKTQSWSLFKETVAKVEKLIQTTEHKRNLPPYYKR